MTPISLTPHEYDALTRLDLPTFVERAFCELNATTPYLDNFHIHVIAAELEAMRRGENTRLIVNVPPRNLKSIIVSVAYVAWLLGHDPATKIICASYGQDLAENLARQCRQVMQSQWYMRLFPKTRLSPSRNSVSDFETTAGGFRNATSVGGAITGLGAAYILLDDPMKPQEALSDIDRANANAWYRHTLTTRLNDKMRGRIVIVMQRLHEDDMAGHVQTIEPWKVLALSAIAPAPETHVIPTAFGTWKHHRCEGEALHPEREPLIVLEVFRRTLGPEYFSAQFLQAPVPPGGNIVKIDKFQRFDIHSPPVFERMLQSWDTANKATELSGYSVCTVWGIVKDRIYLVDVIRERFEYPELRATALALAKGQYRGHRRPDCILVEDKASGQSLIQDLKREGIHTVEAVKPIVDKITRMHDQTAIIADGCVYIPTDARWLAEYLNELIAFPKGRYSDQVDSTSQSLKWFNHRASEPGILTYYRELAAGIKNGGGGAMEDNDIVLLRCSEAVDTLYTKSGAQIGIGGDGLFRMKRADARYLLRNPAWSLVEEP